MFNESKFNPFASKSKLVNSPVKKIDPMTPETLLWKLKNPNLIFGVPWLFDNLIIPWCQSFDIDYKTAYLSALTSQVMSYGYNPHINITKLDDYLKFFINLFTYYYCFLDSESVIQYKRYQNQSLIFLYNIIKNLVYDNTIRNPSIKFPILSKRIHSFLDLLNQTIHKSVGTFTDLLIENILNRIVNAFSFSLNILLIAFVEKYVKGGWEPQDGSFKLQEHSIKFCLKDQTRKITVEKKKGGVQFGCVIIDSIFSGSDSATPENQKKYFIKSHRFYRPTMKFENSHDFELNSANNQFDSYSTASQNQFLFNKREHFNISEFFVYHLFYKLGIGPKVKFLSIPSLPYGIFISTEEVQPSDSYVTMDQLETNDSLKDQLLGSTSLKLQLTLMDIISRIFYLSDMNAGNFCLFFEGNETSPNFSKLMIFDFWIHSIIENSFQLVPHKLRHNRN